MKLDSGTHIVAWDVVSMYPITFMPMGGALSPDRLPSVEKSLRRYVDKTQTSAAGGGAPL